MALWTSEDAAAATGGTGIGTWSVEGLSIDTRSIRPGDMFVALTDQRDGHDFVGDALAKGAEAALVSRRPDGVAEDAPLLIVADVLAGLEDLARAARARTGAKVVGVTGSVGKTSTKEMLRVVLADQGRVHAAESSFNNHWGVPLTLARMPQDADFAVIEIGMNHPGEIAPLSRLTRPDVAMITTVAAAHLEAFENLEGIATEKAAIFEGLTADGIAVVNGDLETSPMMFDLAKASGHSLVSFGAFEGNQFRLRRVQVNTDTTVIEAEAKDTPLLFKLSAPGRHFAMNALGCMAVVAALGGDLGRATLSIAKWSPPAGRGTRETVVLDAAEDLSLDLLDDAFNANPTSLVASLEVLAATRPVDGVGRTMKGRRLAILGDMLELGPDAETLHGDIADLSYLADVHQVHCVGPLMRALYDRLPPEQQGVWVAEAAELAAQVHHLVDAGDVVLVKGSKGSKVSTVVDVIRKLGHPRGALSKGTH